MFVWATLKLYADRRKREKKSRISRLFFVCCFNFSCRLCLNKTISHSCDTEFVSSLRFHIVCLHVSILFWNIFFLFSVFISEIYRQMFVVVASLQIYHTIAIILLIISTCILLIGVAVRMINDQYIFKYEVPFIVAMFVTSVSDKPISVTD